jgi:hypothetical protein
MAAGKLRAIAGAAESEANSGASALFARFRGGEVSFDEYLDARVNEAIAPFNGVLSADRIEWIRSMLREQLATDPVLGEYVRRATGRNPHAT